MEPIILIDSDSESEMEVVNLSASDDDSIDEWRRNRNIDLVVGPTTPASYLKKIEDYDKIRSIVIEVNGWGETRRNPNMPKILEMISTMGHHINIELRLVESEGKFPSAHDYMFARAIELQIQNGLLLESKKGNFLTRTRVSRERADFKVVMDFGKENQDDAFYFLQALKVINNLEIYQKERLTWTIAKLPAAIVSAGACNEDNDFKKEVRQLRVQILSKKLFDGLVADLELWKPMSDKNWECDYYCAEVSLLSTKGDTLSYCVRLQQPKSRIFLEENFPIKARCDMLKRIAFEVGKSKLLRSLCLSLFEYTTIQPDNELYCRNRDDEEKWTSAIFKAFQNILGTLASSKSLEKLFIATPRFRLSETEDLNKAILKICRNQAHKLKSISHNSNGMPFEAALDYLHSISVLPKNSIQYEVVFKEIYGLKDKNFGLEFYDRLIPILPRLAIRRFSLLKVRPVGNRRWTSREYERFTKEHRDYNIPSTTKDEFFRALKANRFVEHINVGPISYDDVYARKFRHHCTNNKMSNLIESIRYGSLPVGIAANTLSSIQASKDWQWGPKERENCKSDSITGLYHGVHAFLPLIALDSAAHSKHMQQSNKRPKLS